MCGRFNLYANSKTIKSQFNLDELSDIEPSYNIAPSENLLVVTQSTDGKKVGRIMRWGLIPSWAKEKRVSNSLINARSETVDLKPAFRGAFAKRRCFVVMSGFFEWKWFHGKKHPYYIKRKKGELIAVAALWEDWQTLGEERIQSSCIITTKANDWMKSIHERMPVLLDEREQEKWLAPSTNRMHLKSLLKPYAHDDLIAYRVSPAMNNPRFKSKQAILPWNH